MFTDTEIARLYATYQDHRTVARLLKVPMSYVMLVVGLLTEVQYEMFTKPF